MALPAMITEFGAQQANYGAAVGESLVKLGQQVGQQLAMREYQRQAAEALPALQESYRNAFGKISRGEIADGYSDLLSASMNPAVAQNPFLSQYASQADQLARSAANAVIQQGFQRGGGRGGTAIPAVDYSKYGFTDETIVEPEGMPTGETQEGVSLTEESDVIPQKQPQRTPQQEGALKNMSDVSALKPDEQAAALKSFGKTQYNKDEFEAVKIPGLDKLVPEVEAILVPKETKFEVTGATRTATGAISERSERIKNENRENFFKSGGTKENIEKAMSEMRDKQMVDLLKKFDGDLVKMRSQVGSQPNSSREGASFNITTPDGKTVRITAEQRQAVDILSMLSAGLAENAGGTPVLYKQRKMTPKDAIAAAKQELGAGASKDQIIKRAKELASQ